MLTCPVNVLDFLGQIASKKPKPNSLVANKDEKLSKKEIALNQALEQIRSSFGSGAIMWLGRSASIKDVPVISTGSLILDVALGVGGLPKVISLQITSQSLVPQNHNSTESNRFSGDSFFAFCFYDHLRLKREEKRENCPSFTRLEIAFI